MFRTWCIAGVCTCMIASQAASALEFEDQLTQDGIPAWEVKGGPASAWAVTDGVLHCTGKGGGWIGTKKSYTDFIIEFEYKIPPGGNSGVFIRVPKEGRPTELAMEAQILDDKAEKDVTGIAVGPFRSGRELPGLPAF